MEMRKINISSLIIIISLRLYQLNRDYHHSITSKSHVQERSVLEPQYSTIMAPEVKS